MVKYKLVRDYAPVQAGQDVTSEVCYGGDVSDADRDKALSVTLVEALQEAKATAAEYERYLIDRELSEPESAPKFIHDQIASYYRHQVTEKLAEVLAMLDVIGYSHGVSLKRIIKVHKAKRRIHGGFREGRVQAQTE